MQVIQADSPLKSKAKKTIPVNGRGCHRPSRIIYGRGVTAPIPVIVTSEGYELRGVVYKSARQLLVAMTGHPEARHWTFARYFRQGQYSRGSMSGESESVSPIMDLFGITVPTEDKVTVNDPTEKVVDTRQERIRQHLRMSKQTVRGIDLQKRAGEVAKLLFAGYGPQIYANRYDPDDVLQEVYKGLLVRNQGKCPWDPSKSSFGHYVHLVAGCLLSNYHRKMNRQRAMEVTGVTVADEGGGTMGMDVSDACGVRDFAGGTTVQSHDMVLYKDFVKWLSDRPSTGKEREAALQILPMVLGNWERGDISLAMGMSKPVVSRALSWLRAQMGVWTMDGFLVQ